MSIFRTEGIRLTVPISEDLSRHLTLCAFAADLSRGQLVRRLLAVAVGEAERRHANLAGLSVDAWLNGISKELADSRARLELIGQAENEDVPILDKED